MIEARGIVLLSFPFAAGIVLAQICPFSLFHPALGVVACLALLAGSDVVSGKGWYAVLFFAMGVLCGAVRFPVGPGMTGAASWPGMTGAASWPAGPAIFRRALERSDALIRSIPFRDGQTGALLRALLTGQRDGLPRETIECFRSAGASHILALSGLHLGIIYLLLGRFLKLMGNGRAMSLLRSALLVSACTFFALMTGAAPSIVRALLFIALNEILSHRPGRRKDPLSVWCCALMLQLSFAPWVIASPGFQLSYLAMLGIFTLFPRMDAWFPVKGRVRGPVHRIWSSMALSISCQVFTAPLVWLRFGTFPKYFLITNLLALPLTSALMLGAVSCLLLYAAGICPSWLINSVDYLSGLLIGTLGTIASIP